MQNHNRHNRIPMTTVQRLTGVIGVTFLLVGIAGFIPGLTQNLDEIAFAGTESDAQLLGIFKVSVLHNLVHVAFGVVGLAVVRSWNAARGFLIFGGAIYLVLWVYGLVIDLDSNANFVPLNTADNWLHFGLGAGMVGLGFTLTAEAARQTGDGGSLAR